MQLDISNVVDKHLVGFIDPQRIAERCFNFPSKWDLKCEQLAAGKTKKEKENIRKKAIKDEAYKVVAYIAKAFYNMQDRGMIYLPYNFK